MSKKKRKKKDIGPYFCEHCGMEHDGSYGSGRFCSELCAKAYSQSFITSEGRAKQIEALMRPSSKKRARERQIEEYNKRPRDNAGNVEHPQLKEKAPIKTKSTSRIGKLGEYKVAEKFISRDIPTYLPMTEAEEADIVAEFGGKLQKVQVKTSNMLSGARSEAVVFSLTNSDHHVNRGKLLESRKKYSTSAVDYFALYSLPDDEVYLVKNDGEIKNMYIRHEYPISGQRKNIHLAKDYEIDHVLDIIEAGMDPDDIVEAEFDIIDDE